VRKLKITIVCGTLAASFFPSRRTRQEEDFSRARGYTSFPGEPETGEDPPFPYLPLPPSTGRRPFFPRDGAVPPPTVVIPRDSAAQFSLFRRDSTSGSRMVFAVRRHVDPPSGHGLRVIYFLQPFNSKGGLAWTLVLWTYNSWCSL